MDLTRIVNTLGDTAEDIVSGQAGVMPPVQPKTPQGKRGYDHAIDALNRLPRPLMAIGSLALFAVAAYDPQWFEARMQALAVVPEPMWWLLGAVMTCFFGAREAHYLRQKGTGDPPAPKV
jgi:hypothetical protein